ncbi:hypothetical protein Pelo_1379 [Pelomyxa schiedti]|nr:hypothetical protein Pelo_1379 [Pelomyxa schiedti]
MGNTKSHKRAASTATTTTTRTTHTTRTEHPASGTYVDNIIDARQQFVAMACASSQRMMAATSTTTATTTAGTSSRPRGVCAMAGVASLMRHFGETYVVSERTHVAMSFDAAGAATGECRRVHVCIGVSPTMGVVASRVAVTAQNVSALSHIDVKNVDAAAGDLHSAGGVRAKDKDKERMIGVFDCVTGIDANETVFRVFDRAGSERGKLMSPLTCKSVLFLRCDTKWLVAGPVGCVYIQRIDNFHWSPGTRGSVESADEALCVSYDTLEVMYVGASFVGASKDQVLLLSTTPTFEVGGVSFLDLNATTTSKKLVITRVIAALPNPIATVVGQGGALLTLHVLVQKDTSDRVRVLYNTETGSVVHTFPRLCKINGVINPDCISETVSYTNRVLCTKNFNTPLYSQVGSTWHVHTASGVIATVSKTPPGTKGLGITFQDARTGSILAVLNCPHLSSC